MPFGQALNRVASGVGTVGAFNDGVREGVWNGGKSLVTGIVTIAGKALQYGGDSTVLGRAGDSLRGVTGTMTGWLEATIPSKQRGLASDAAIGAAGKAFDYLNTHTPEQAGADIAGAVSKAWSRLEADNAKAAAQGPDAEARWLGQITGRTAFEIASFAVPVTKLGLAGKAAGAAAHTADAAVDIARAGDAVADGARVAYAGRVAGKAPLVGDALKIEAVATVGKSMAVAKAVRAMSPIAAREFLLGLDNFAARENILRTLVSDPKLLDIATKPNTATFYSGRVELKAGQYLKAREWAETFSNRIILEQTSGGRWLDQIKAYKKLINQPVADEIWTTLSRRYAESVSGEVVVVKGAMRSDAVLHAEMKILKAAEQSGKITSLEIIDLQTAIEKLGK